jgi:Kef-type K+ transport system membrane component KefB
MDTVIELVIILLVAVGICSLMQLLRQPLIIGYIATGILVAVTGIVTPGDAIESFAHIGIVLLLFLVGLNLSPRTIKETGKVALFTGIGQVIFTSLIGFIIALLLGFERTEGLYLALGLTFSSTIIISKLLSDKGDLQTLYGRIAIGFLIVQDIVAIIVLMALTGFGEPLELFRNLLLIVAAGVVLAFLLKYLTPFMAKSQELLLLFSITFSIAVAGAFSYVGLSLEAGALLAGITLSSSTYRHEIGARLKPLRDFFILMFFIILGAQMDFSSGASLILPAIIFSLFILIGNPLIVIAIMGALGYTKKAGFQAGLTVAQISEFSLIMIALGVSLGHVSQELLSMATIIGVITIAASTYMILYADNIYPHVKTFLSIFEQRRTRAYKQERKHEIIIFGSNRIGFGILKTFHKLQKRFLVIDYDPKRIARLEKMGIDCRYGDAEDLEMLAELTHEHMKMGISTIPNLETNLLLLNTLKQSNPHIIFAVVAQTTADALSLYEAGATYVVLPHHIGGDHMGSLIERHGLNPELSRREDPPRRRTPKHQKGLRCLLRNQLERILHMLRFDHLVGDCRVHVETLLILLDIGLVDSFLKTCEVYRDDAAHFELFPIHMDIS